MSFAFVLLWTGLRTIVIAAIAVALAVPIAAWFASARSGWMRAVAAILLIAPLPMPGLVVAYAYANFALSPLGNPWASEAMHANLQVMLLLPVAVGVLYFSPPPSLSPQGRHCRRLLTSRGFHRSRLNSACNRDQRKARRHEGTEARRGTDRSRKMCAGGAHVATSDSKRWSVARWLGLGGRSRAAIVQAFRRLGGSLALPLARRRFSNAMAFAVHGRARAPLLAFAAVFLLAFGDFEMASLFGVPAWTVRLFRAQVGGLPLASSLQLALAPAACEAIVLGAGLLILIRTRRTAPGQLAGQTVIKTTGSIGVWCCLAVSFTCVCVVPAVLLGPHTWSAMGTLAQEMQIASYLRASIVFAATTTIVAWFAAHWVTRRGGVSVMGLALCVPGLFGALVIGLCVLWLFQMPAWQMFYDTPAPLLMALMALMLPIAVLLRLLLAAHRTSPAIHVVRLLAWSPNAPLRRAAASLQWHMRGRMHLAALLLLFVWAFFDVVASAMLAPIDMTPASVLLYNQMHYGRSAMLSAMVCVTVLTPVLLAMMVFACRRALGRWWPAYE